MVVSSSSRQIPAAPETLDNFAITALYKTVTEHFDTVDSWAFQQAPSNYQDFLAARIEKIKPIIEEALQAFEAIIPLCTGDPQDPEINARLEIAARIKLMLDTEYCITNFLQNPAQKDKMIWLNEELPYKNCFSIAYRIYRYLVWHRRTYPATPTPQENGVAAVLRVKNESLHLRLMLPVLLAYFDEIIVVDHNSSDDTYAYVASLNHPKIKLFKYTEKTAHAGEFYTHELESGEGSLAAYYNFAFDQATAAYVCKWDADMYPLPALGELLNMVRSGQHDVVRIVGVDCFGYNTCNSEARIYPRAKNFRYTDAPYYEMLDITGKNLIATVDTPVYLHMKQDALLKREAAIG